MMFTVCNLGDLLVKLPSGLNWSPMTVTSEALGFFSFAGGNMTYDGLSPGSTAMYRTSADYHINGGKILWRMCLSNMWTPQAEITSEGGRTGHTFVP